MAVIRDVMPAFELFQPANVNDALTLLERHGSNAWILAGGLDTFDWLKDRSKRTNVVIDLSQMSELRGIKEVAGGVEIGALTTLPGGRATDPKPGDAGGERVAGHAVLVLPERVDVLPGGGEHLLRGHADGDQPGACDSERGPVRGGEPVGHGAGADRAGREDGDPEPKRGAGGGRGAVFRGAGDRDHADDGAAAGGTADGDPDPGDVGGRAVLLREGARPAGVGFSGGQPGGGGGGVGGGGRGTAGR